MTFSTQASSIRPYVLVICCILVALSVAILPFCFSYISIKLPVNLLFIALGLFVIVYARSINMQEFKAIWLVLVCLILVIGIAYLSLYFAYNIGATKQAIRQYLLEPSLFLLMSYLIVRRLNDKELMLFFVLLCVALCYHPLVTLYDFFSSKAFAKSGFSTIGYYRAMLPHYHTPATVYAFYLLVTLGMSLSLAIFMRGVWRLAAVGFVLLCFGAIIANGGRFALLSALVILLSPLLLYSYTHKRAIVLGVFVALCVGFGALYAVSEKWGARYNFHSMINNFYSIWNTPPAEMGKYNKGCKATSCSPHSLDKPSDISMEYSSLSRISMLKSSILAILENPLRPNGFHFQQFPYNIQNIFPLDSINHPFPIASKGGERIFPHAHNHNHIVSFWFELGAIGFVCVALVVWVLLRNLYTLHIPLTHPHQARISPLRACMLSGIGFSIVGLVVANIFDCIPVRDGHLILFLLFGTMLALQYPANIQSSKDNYATNNQTAL